ncbi:MAG TPA: SRPBCC domain-containing protein [Gammaproteobacteria bacterium]
MIANRESEAGRTLDLARTFDAPRDLVFRMWTDPEHFAQWCAPARFVITGTRIDLRRGGVWWSDMRAPDGETCAASGVYREIVPPERLVFTYAHEMPDGSRGPETLVTVTFEEQQGKTNLRLHQSVFDSVENRVAHVMGWNECLDRLDARLAQADLDPA